MGATPNLGLRWPELPSQADGPAAFQNLATDVENKMTNYRGSSAWNGDATIQCPPGTQVNVFNQDVPAVAIGWCWIDINMAIAVGGPNGTGGAIPTILNAGGQLIVSGQNLSQELRRFRWHSRFRTEMFYVGGGCAMALPASISVINIQVTFTVDGTSSGQGGLYEYNVGLTQFGAARG